MWEYLIANAEFVPYDVNATDLSPFSGVDCDVSLTDLGKHGWELCGIIGLSGGRHYFYFKRPLVGVLPATR